MSTESDLISELSKQYQHLFEQQKVILSFTGYLSLLKRRPRQLIRSSAEFIKDAFEHFGTREISLDKSTKLQRFKLFDMKSEKSGPIIGGETVQNEIYQVLANFCRQGYASKLIMLHGPNGSAKTSTVEAISHAMQLYSATDEGAVYRFNWIFPTDRSAMPKVKGESGPIGFGSASGGDGDSQSYALLDDNQIACKLQSEFKDNPIFLLPKEQRKLWLTKWIAEAEGIPESDVEIPNHILQPGLSKKNQLILENLLAAYEGNMERVLRHIQVERFFYSRQYRVGISTIEPQMSIDAGEKILTMDSNIANLPAVLQNIRFTEAHGELVEANRGLLEFSDLLKRPLEAFKYLLNTVERGTLNLPTSTANLDIVFIASSNEKHLDSFKTVPDFSSFRSRFELITVPYLLLPSQEEEIYAADVRAIAKKKVIAPHAVKLLCVWAVMTRLKQPDPEHYPNNNRALISRLDPRNKVRLYEGQTLQPWFKASEETTLKGLRSEIWNESVGLVVYEGRFGASPREVRGILQRAAQGNKHRHLTPMAVFDELERITKDRTVYEFLQFEPRGKYHDAKQFIEIIKDEFADIFENEVLAAMSLVEEGEYEKLLGRYVENVVAHVKKEKLYNPSTESYQAPSETLMKEIEQIIGVQGSVDRHREGMLGKIAAFKLDHPNDRIDVKVVFENVLKRIEEHYFQKKKEVVDSNYRAMLTLGTDDEKNLKDEQREMARTTFHELNRRFGYSEELARDSLKFLLKRRKDSQ